MDNMAKLNEWDQNDAWKETTDLLFSEKCLMSLVLWGQGFVNHFNFNTQEEQANGI